MEQLTRGIANLIRPALDSESKDESLGNLLMSCADQRVFSKGGAEVSSVVSIINTKLNESSTRYDGLILLQTFLPQCSLEILSQNASSWMQFCLKSIPVPKTSGTSFDVFKILLEQSVLLPELTKYVSSVIVASLAEQIHQGIPPQAFPSALTCLEKCMWIYKGPCGPHRKVFERFLFSMADFCTGSDRFLAARCVAMLPQIGGGGVGGIQYENSWVAQQISIIGTLHLLLDELYANVNELNFVGNKFGEFNPLPLPTIEESDPIRLVQKLKARLTNVSAYLSYMLLLPYPVPKEIYSEDIIDLICRGLAVTGSSLGKSTTTHNLALFADLPYIHTVLLKVLDSLIITGKTNILPFATLICKLAVQSLKWTSVVDWPFSYDKPYSFLRKQAYDTLKKWCSIAKGGSNVDDVAQQLVELWKSDVYEGKETVSLSQTSMFNKKHNNPKRKGNSSSHNGNSTKDHLVETKSANMDVCVAALQAMQAVIMSASYQVQPAVHIAVSEIVVTVLLKITNKIEDAPTPYSNSKPRLELYKLLLQLVMNSHPKVPPPTSVALKLFSCGQRDPEVDVSMVCQLALSAVDKIIHPAHASLKFMPDRRELEMIEGAAVHSKTQSTSNDSKLSHTQLKDTKDDSEHEITDASSMLHSPFSPKHRSTLLTRAVLGSGEKRAVPEASSINNSSTPQASNVNTTIDLRSSTKEQTKLLIEQNKRPESIDLTSPASLLKKGEISCTDDEEKEDPTKTVDLTMSDKSDDEADISEVPCEIDLADSDDDRSNLSMCSQTTLNTPQTDSTSQASKVSVSISTAKVDSSEVPTTPAKTADLSIHEQDTMAATSIVLTIQEEPSVVITPSEQNPGNGNTEAEVSKQPEAAENPEAAEATEGTDKKRLAEDEGDSSTKKQKLSEEFEFDSGEEDALLLSFQDVTREEVEDGNDQ